MKNTKHKPNHAEQSGEQRVKSRVEDREWRTENGKQAWRTENGKQRIKNREWRMEDIGK